MSDNNTAETDIRPAVPFTGKKLYYTISEVSAITGLKDSVLRSWDKEFTQLRPKRSSSGVRSYKTKDIELILYIKRLLHEEKYTITGARQRITEERRAERLNGGTGSGYDESSGDNQYQYEKQYTEHGQSAVPRQSQSGSPEQTESSPSTQTQARLSGLISDIRGEIVTMLKILES